MLSINRTYFYIFIYVFLIQLPCIDFITFLDEFTMVLLISLICLDLIVNRNFKRYKCLYLVIGVFAFYALYSMVMLNFNTVPAILNDFVLQMKPFIPFCVAYAIAPNFTSPMKFVIKWICIITSMTLLILIATDTIYSIITHVAAIGILSFNCFLVYLYCSIKEDGNIELSDLFVCITILLIGLLSTRSKYYGEFIMALYFLFFYKPGALKRVKLKQIVLFIMTIIITIAVAWNKIEYYFILGNSDTFDIDQIQAYARPVLYITMYFILQDYPLLGSGLASFATSSSGPEINYSLVYSKYGIDQVWGLSEQMPDFINDAFFSEFAQFGLIGIGLFIFFFIWIYQKIRLWLYFSGKRFYITGVLGIMFIMIESVAGSTFLQAGCMMIMMLLGMIAAKFKHISRKEASQVFKLDYI